MYQLMKGIAYCHEHRVLHRVRIISRHWARDGHANRSEQFFWEHLEMQILTFRLIWTHVSPNRTWSLRTCWSTRRATSNWEILDSHEHLVSLSGVTRMRYEKTTKITQNKTLTCSRPSLPLPPLLVCSLFYGVKNRGRRFSRFLDRFDPLARPCCSCLGVIIMDRKEHDRRKQAERATRSIGWTRYEEGYLHICLPTRNWTSMHIFHALRNNVKTTTITKQPNNKTLLEN